METKYKIHAGYIVAILLACIVLLITVKTTKIPDLVEYLSFALTLTALVLAILAIVYGLFSNSSILSTLSSLREYSSTATASTEKLSSLTAALQDVVACIPDKLASVEDKVTATQILLEQQNAEVPAGESARIAPPNDELARSFLNISSFTGSLGLYAAHRALLGDGSLDLESAFDARSQDYVLGFLVAASAAGWVDFTHDGGKLKIEEMNKVIRDEVLGKMEAWIAGRDTEHGKEFARRRIQKLESYFSDQSVKEAVSSEPEPATEEV